MESAGQRAKERGKPTGADGGGYPDVPRETEVSRRPAITATTQRLGSPAAAEEKQLAATWLNKGCYGGCRGSTHGPRLRALRFQNQVFS